MSDDEGSSTTTTSASSSTSSSYSDLTPRAMADAALAKAMHDLAESSTTTTTSKSKNSSDKKKSKKTKKKKKKKKSDLVVDDDNEEGSRRKHSSKAFVTNNTNSSSSHATKPNNKNNVNNLQKDDYDEKEDHNYSDMEMDDNNGNNDADAFMMKHNLDQAWGCITNNNRNNKNNNQRCKNNNNNSNRDTHDNNNSNANHLDVAYEKTTQLIHTQVESLLRKGIAQFHKSDAMTREIQLLKEQLQAKDLEIQRLRASEENNRQTISNLYQSLETAKADQMKLSNVVIQDNKLRQQMNATSIERDQYSSQVADLTTKNKLLRDELQQTKLKLHHSTQEKIKLENEQRAALSSSQRADDHHVSIDCDFYKRKVAELNANVQGKNAAIAEKNRQIHELRNQLERSLSQNRLAANIHQNNHNNTGNGSRMTSWNNSNHTRKRPAL